MLMPRGCPTIHDATISGRSLVGHALGDQLLSVTLVCVQATLIGKRAAREKAVFKGVTRHRRQPSGELRSPTAIPPQ